MVKKIHSIEKTGYKCPECGAELELQDSIELLCSNTKCKFDRTFMEILIRTNLELLDK